MTLPAEHEIHNQIIHNYQIAYLIISKELKILSHNEAVYHFTPLRHILNGLPVGEVFPELFSLEGQLIKPDSPLILQKLHRITAENNELFFDLRVEPTTPQDDTLLVTMLDVTYQALLEQRLVQQRNELRLGVANLHQTKHTLRRSAHLNPQQFLHVLAVQLVQLIRTSACFVIELKTNTFNVITSHAVWQMAEMPFQQLNQICPIIQQQLAKSSMAQLKIELPIIQEQGVRFVMMSAFVVFLGSSDTKLVVLLDDNLERIFTVEEKTFVQLAVEYAVVLMTDNKRSNFL